MAQNGGFDPSGIKADDRAPKSVVRYGYGALFLFAITAAVASWSGGRLGSFIIVAVVVVGFLLALLAFDSMVRSKSATWRALGLVFSSVALLGILIVFLAVLSFLLSGWPPALGPIFGQAAAKPIAGLSVRSINSRSATIAWDAYDDPAADVLISPVLRAGANQATGTVKAKAGAGEALIEGLEQGTQYRFRVAVRSHFQDAPVREISATTDARGLFIESGSYRFYYSGKMTPEGKANDESATSIFEEFVPGVRWQFKGPVREGKLNGAGALQTVAENCDHQTCGSRCKVNMNDGVLGKGQCEIDLHDESIKVVPAGDSDSIGMYFNGLSEYTGEIVGFNADELAPDGTVWLGPFRALFDGKGTFRNPATSTEISGSWAGGALSGSGKVKQGEGPTREAWGEYEEGRLKNGYQWTYWGDKQPIDYEAHEYIDFLPQGAGIIFNSNMVAFGDGNASGNVEDGYRLAWSWSDPSDFEGVVLRPGDKREYLSLTSSKQNDQCAFEETAGLFPGNNGWLYSGQWALQCGRSTDPDGVSIECSIDSDPRGIYIRASRRMNGVPEIDIGLGINSARDSALKIDDSVFDSGGKGYGLRRKSPIAIAKLCTGKQVTNQTNAQSFSTNGFCKLAAAMFARLYNCI